VTLRLRCHFVDFFSGTMIIDSQTRQRQPSSLFFFRRTKWVVGVGGDLTKRREMSSVSLGIARL
jgi:hypothetical protein